MATGTDGLSYGLTPDQAEVAATIARVAINRGLPDHAVTVALATGMVESRLTNLDYGDADSLGVFQQRPSMGWGSAEQVMDVEYAAGKFYDHLMKVPNWQDLPVTEAAQAVQRSAFPDRYADWEAMSRAWAAALTGETTASLACALEPASGTNAAQMAADVASAIPGATLTQSGGNAETGEIRYTLAFPTLTDPSTQSRAIWQAASWLMTHARDYGITRIEASGQYWTRTTQSPTWRSLTKTTPSDSSGVTDDFSAADSAGIISITLG